MSVKLTIDESTSVRRAKSTDLQINKQVKLFIKVFQTTNYQYY